jgi:hypothetical protein
MFAEESASPMNEIVGPTAIAQVLLRTGEWDAALALLAAEPATEADALRARILVARHWWRIDDPGTALAAVGALDPTVAETRYLAAQLAYARVVFDRRPRIDDPRTAEAGFRAAAADDVLGGWGTFWLGVVAEHIHRATDTASTRYDEALQLCRADGDRFLEFYVLRHQGVQALARDRRAGVRLLRRSLELGVELGARPQVSAAQVTLADQLPNGAERRDLRRAARATADELGLTWVQAALNRPRQPL